ncbi:MAG: iron donor protein CyaY [Burkholderiaceae bacterium]
MQHDDAQASRLTRELDSLQQSIETAAEGTDVDIDVRRSGNVIEVEFPDRTRLVINTQEFVGEIWVAARTEGLHFRQAEDGRWLDTRSGRELRAALSEMLSVQAGVDLAVG